MAGGVRAKAYHREQGWESRRKILRGRRGREGASGIEVQRGGASCAQICDVVAHASEIIRLLTLADCDRAEMSNQGMAQTKNASVWKNGRTHFAAQSNTRGYAIQVQAVWCTQLSVIVSASLFMF